MIPLGGLVIDIRVLAFTVGASLFTSLLFGALPALQTRNVDLRSSMAAGSRAVAGGSNRLRQGLIGGQVALTVVLVAGAGLLVRSLIYLETLPPGFDATNVMTAKLSLDDARYRDAAAFHTLIDQSLAAMQPDSRRRRSGRRTECALRTRLERRRKGSRTGNSRARTGDPASLMSLQNIFGR